MIHFTWLFFVIALLGNAPPDDFDRFKCIFWWIKLSDVLNYSKFRIDFWKRKLSLYYFPICWLHFYIYGPHNILQVKKTQLVCHLKALIVASWAFLALKLIFSSPFSQANVWQWRTWAAKRLGSKFIHPHQRTRTAGRRVIETCTCARPHTHTARGVLGPFSFN